MLMITRDHCFVGRFHRPPCRVCILGVLDRTSYLSTTPSTACPFHQGTWQAGQYLCGWVFLVHGVLRKSPLSPWDLSFALRLPDESMAHMAVQRLSYRSFLSTSPAHRRSRRRHTLSTRPCLWRHLQRYRGQDRCFRQDSMDHLHWACLHHVSMNSLSVIHDADGQRTASFLFSFAGPHTNYWGFAFNGMWLNVVGADL